ncbi:uncharacterized protein [Ambystoma mexicanum]|uniref:uncharacterized protein n=1 Tax=Ambystoma mexicanum TaxID=8296 RepID=UPI0037E7D342
MNLTCSLTLWLRMQRWLCLRPEESSTAKTKRDMGASDPESQCGWHPPPRTVKDVKKRWDDLRLRVHNILSANWSQGLATGSGSNTPIKLSRWEETCTSTIGIESIEGVGEMECGASSSADVGRDTNSDAEDSAAQATTPTKRARSREDTNRPSISKGTGKAHQQPRTKAPLNGRKQGRHRSATTPTVPTPVESSTVEPVADGTLSVATSLVGEAAATAPQSGDEVLSQGEVCVPEEDNRFMEFAGTPSPTQAHQHTPISSQRHLACPVWGRGRSRSLEPHTGPTRIGTLATRAIHPQRGPKQGVQDVIDGGAPAGADQPSETICLRW